MPGRLGTGAYRRGHGQDRRRKGPCEQDLNPWERTPTPTQQARWKGLSLRAISRELAFPSTVCKHVYAEKPPTKKLSTQERAKLKALRKIRNRFQLATRIFSLTGQ